MHSRRFPELTKPKKWGQALTLENLDIETEPIIDELWRRNA